MEGQGSYPPQAPSAPHHPPAPVLYTPPNYYEAPPVGVVGSYPPQGPSAPPHPPGPVLYAPNYYEAPPASAVDTYVPERSPAFYQQMQVAWMQAPAPIPNCPPGLEYLTMIDQIFVYQLFEFIEALTGFETKNKYELKNSMGQRVYFAVEESEFCNRLCCGANRAFSIKIMDNLNQTVLHLVRPLGCHSCWCPCLHHRMEVQAPPGTIIGYVVQEWNPCIPILSIQNEMSETILKIRGPCMQFSCCGDVNFKVLSKDESTVVGKISKKWTGLLREFFTDADNFGIQFPMDLDVKVKAVLIGACIMVDFLYFEQNSGGKHGAWQMM